MGDIVNLRRMKKHRAKAEQAQAAKENRIRHARTMAQKANDARGEARHQAKLDSERRD